MKYSKRALAGAIPEIGYNVRQLDSTCRSSVQSGKPKDAFEGKLADASHPLTHGVVPSVFVRKFHQPWNTVSCGLLYSK